MDVKGHWKPLLVGENASQAAEMTNVNYFFSSLIASTENVTQESVFCRDPQLALPG